MQKKELLQKIIGTALMLASVVFFFVFRSIRKNFDDQAIFLCEAVSSNPLLEMAQCPAHTSSTPTLITLGFVITAMLFLVGFLLLITSKIISLVKNKNEDLSFSVDLNLLEEGEKTICTLLLENKGSMYQSDLIKKTEFSKVQITRILDKLEGKKICERKRRGMTNIVILK